MLQRVKVVFAYTSSNDDRLLHDASQHVIWIPKFQQNRTCVKICPSEFHKRFSLGPTKHKPCRMQLPSQAIVTLTTLTVNLAKHQIMLAS